MQNIFDAKVTPEEYEKQGKGFGFPGMCSCNNPNCDAYMMNTGMQRFGFYKRSVLDGAFNKKILIRRYRCKYCKMTFSYLPSFCLPYYQHSLRIIFLILLNTISQEKTATEYQKTITEEYPKLPIYRQHIEFYLNRFKENLKSIKFGLRQLMPEVKLPDEGDKKEAQEVFNIVNNGFDQIHTFSQRFFVQCKSSFMASIQNILAQPKGN